MKTIKRITIDDPLTSRKQEGQNQRQYWGRVGVTQSGGSRFESGRNVPNPVRMLIALATGKATIEQLKNGELASRIG